MKTGKKVLLFAPQGFEDIEIAAFTDILGWTRVLKDVTPVDVVIAGFKKHIRSKHGLSIVADVLLKDVKAAEFQAVIIPGGHNDCGYTETYHEKVLDVIRTVYENGGVVAAMCVGAIPVARSGILKGKKATTYIKSKRHDNLQLLKDCGVVPVKKRIVVSDRIITNRGPDTSSDAAFKLVELLNGRDDMEKLKDMLMF